MHGAEGSRVGEVNPDEAWKILVEQPTARLIDVRTRAELSFVGAPDLSEIGKAPIFSELTLFPDMSSNPRFVEEVTEALGENPPETLLFLCRSGARSLRAAYAITEALTASGWTGKCLNVAEGFEGDLDVSGHRGGHNGWKARGLAWRQS